MPLAVVALEITGGETAAATVSVSVRVSVPVELVALVELPVDVPPRAVLVVFPPLIVPVVVFVEFWLVWGLFVGLMVTFAAELLEAAEVPLKLLLLVVPEADEGLEVFPTV